MDWTGGLTQNIVCFCCCCFVLYLFMPPNEIHMPVGFQDASYSPKNSILLAQTDLANI